MKLEIDTGALGGIGVTIPGWEKKMRERLEKTSERSSLQKGEVGEERE